ncbi:MAG: ABC transporter substrate-binding protein, partial [Clostridiales bacterium]|nr:ABC transporter substrate-binding protein [Clostridiales bacterium]
KIQDAKDLEGKNVIVPEGTSIQYFWENYAAEKGIDTKKVNIINAVEDAASLLMTGDADAVVSTAYGIQSYVYMGVGRILDTGAGLENAHSTYVTVAKSSYLKENPDAAVAINKALIDAYQAVTKDADVLYESSAGDNLPATEWEKVYAYDTSFSYLNPEITSSEKDYWETFNQWLYEHKLIKENIDLDSFIDTSYYEKAIAE